MAWTVDARVPVRFGTADEAGADDALLIEGVEQQSVGPSVCFDLAAFGHGPECACCVPRSPVALALNILFQQRARGEIAFFRRVVAVTRSAEGDAAVWAALRGDPLTAGRFRLID